MYYIIADGQIVDDSWIFPKEEDLQKWADDLKAHVYVIQGEHAGVTADPKEEKEQEDEKE
jgi:hypothetical protein